MASPLNADAISLLRRRFLAEEPEHLTEWLWEEHPQTAAFVLNWLGSPELLTAYLSPLPFLQQADMLYRIARLEPGRPLTPVQEELLVEALRRLTPYLREADAELAAAEVEPVQGERLLQAYLYTLRAAERRPFLQQMEEVDPVLARLAGTLSRHAPDRAGPAAETIHGVLNDYGNLLSHAMSRWLGTRALVYPERVEMVSAEAERAEEEDPMISFRLTLPGTRSVGYLRLSLSLFFHYLEATFGAAHPFFLHSPTKPEFSDIENGVAVAFAQELADELTAALGLEREAAGYRAALLSAEGYAEALDRHGRTPLLHSRLTLKIGQALGGQMALLLPPSHLVDLQALCGRDLFRTLLDEVPVAREGEEESGPAADFPPVAGESATPQAPGAQAPEATEADPAVIEDAGDAGSSLEDFLWRIELEEAERASEREEVPPPQPLDLFLQDYAPEQVDRRGHGSQAEHERRAELHYFYGSRLFQKGHYAEAAEALEQALEDNPEHHGARLLLAAAWGEQGLYFREIVGYRQLIAAEQALPEAWVLLSRRLSFLGRVDDAFSALESAIDQGFRPQEVVEADPCFRNLRRSVKWRQFMVDNA